MVQSLVAIGALALVLLLSLSVGQAGDHDTRQHVSHEVETRALAILSERLDRLRTLPLTHTGGHGLDDWNGRSEVIRTPYGLDTLVFTLQTEVEAVGKQGGSFVPVHRPAPFRRVRLRLEGDMGVALDIEQVFTDPIR